MIVVVTGASGALGGTLSRRLVKAGHKVAALGSAGAGLDALGAELGAACLAVPLDLRAPAAWASALPAIEAALGAPDGAVLCAGGWAGGHAFWEAPEGELSGMLAANLDTAQQSLRALLPGMVARGRGSVVVIGSRAVERPWSSTNAAAYAASKSGLVALAQVVAAEVLEKGVRINAVLPSTIATAANRAAMPAAEQARWVTAESLSEVIAFLLSDASRDVSGAAIPVYGRA